jgi:hypothetical protein
MADLVANITVAQFAPAMAYAACFVCPSPLAYLTKADRTGWTVCVTHYLLSRKLMTEC